MRYLMALVALFSMSTLVSAQSSTDEGYFEMARLNTDFVGAFEAFAVDETHSLAEALAGGLITEDTAVLVTETAAGKLALLTDQMWWHHLAQGEAAGEPWLVSF